MKVKNIMFSGVMAAILGATAAQAADPVQLISKTYADNKLQSKLTQTDNAGANIAISADGKISATGLVTTDTYTEKVGALEAKDTELAGEIAKKLDTTTYTAKIEEIEGVLAGVATTEGLGELKDQVQKLDGDVNTEGSVKKQIAAAIASEVGRADGKYATEADLTTAEGRIGALEQTANALGTTYAAKSYETKVDTNTNDITTIKAEQTTQNGKIAALEGQFGETGTTTVAIKDAQDAADAAQDAADAAQGAADAAQADVDAVEQSLADNGTIAKANAAAVKTEVQSALALKADASALNDYRTSAAQDLIDNEIKASITDITEDGGVIDTKVGELETTLDGRLTTLEAIDHTKFATTEALAGVNTTAEQGVADAAAAQAAADAAQADADANATAIQGKVDSIGAGKAGSYIIDFDADGKASYTQITII